jgi:hypothetical protein
MTRLMIAAYINTRAPGSHFLFRYGLWMLFTSLPLSLFARKSRAYGRLLAAASSPGLRSGGRAIESFLRTIPSGGCAQKIGPEKPWSELASMTG